MKHKRLISLALVTLLGACTTENTYNLIQSNRQSACPEDLNTHSRDECLKGLNKVYQEYERERKELLKRTD